MSKKQNVLPYNDQHSVLYEHHRQHSLEDGDKLAFETIVDEEKRLEESEFKKSEFAKTKSLIKIASEMIKHTDWEWSDSIGLGYYLNFRKDKIVKDYSYMIDESFKYNTEKKVFENSSEEIPFETVEIWKEYVMCIRYLFKEYGNFIMKTSFDYADVLEYEPKGNSERSAYAIVRDTKRKKLLLLIEGTKTFHDLLTDLNTDAVAFECETFKKENISNQFVHSGMIERAYWFYYQIIPKIENYLATDYSHYTFELVGHSLGAGTASILTLLIIPKLPDVKCLAFACPKIFSHELARSDLVKRHITTFINQDDFVPLFSVESFRDFKTNRMVNWKSEVMNETQLGKFIKSTDQFMNQNGVYGAFNNVKNTFKSGYNYIVNGSQPTTSVLTTTKKPKKTPPPLPKNLLKKRLIKLQEYKEEEIDEEDENFFLNLVKQYEENAKEENEKENETENKEDNEVDSEIPTETTQETQETQEESESTEPLPESQENAPSTPENQELFSSQISPIMDGVDEASDPNNDDEEQYTDTSSVSRDLPPLPKSFITGVHLYSPENIMYFRTINDRTYMKKCVPSEFEQLNFGQKYVADHFSSSYINAISGVLDSITAVQQAPQLPPLPPLPKLTRSTAVAKEDDLKEIEIVSVVPVIETKKSLPPLPAHLLKAKSPVSNETIEPSASTTSEIVTTVEQASEISTESVIPETLIPVTEPTNTESESEIELSYLDL